MARVTIRVKVRVRVRARVRVRVRVMVRVMVRVWAVGGARGGELLGGDALGREAEVDEVLRDRVVVLGVDVRDELEQRVLQVLRHGWG